MKAQKIENTEKQKYFELLSKLVKIKMQLDIENLVEDEFDDLRKDFRNIINNDVLKKIETLEAVDVNKFMLLTPEKPFLVIPRRARERTRPAGSSGKAA